MKDKEKEILSLLELMDDENEQTASLAMAELLQTDQKKFLARKLCELQEDDNQCTRKRVHQLQSAIRSRRERLFLAEGLRDRTISLLEGLICLHLIWFDNDTMDEVVQQWQALREDLFQKRPANLIRLAEFMMGHGFCHPLHDYEPDPDHYCIGYVLDGLPGSDLLLSAVASLVTEGTPFKLRIFRKGLQFGVADPDGFQLYPGENWRLVPPEKGEILHPVSDMGVLRMTASMILTSAAATDGFRYFYTASCAVAASFSHVQPDFLPYPYNTGER